MTQKRTKNLFYSLASLDDPSSRVLSRRRRFLNSDGFEFTFTTAFTLAVPMSDVGTTLTLTAPFSWDYTKPNDT